MDEANANPLFEPPSQDQNSQSGALFRVDDRVQVFLDSEFWKSEGWYPGTIIRIDPYSAHRSFIWVELDTPITDGRGGMRSVLSVFNPKNIKKLGPV
ncbi:MAG: hypothetical protein P4L50_09875 [Anaerolineaceae bacterium]|nr:hypothetical protein [Anaerolineaceae bacterium]